MSVLERPDRRCGATNRQGARCGNMALRGQRVCRFHGGKSPQAKQAAARREAERRAFAALSRHKADPVDNPLEAFRQLAGEVIFVKDWARKRVEELDELRYRGASGEQLRGEFQAFERLLDLCRRVLADYGRLNVDERLAAIDERVMAAYTQHAFEGLQAVLEQLLPEEFRPLALALVSARLRGSPAPVEGSEALSQWQALLAAAGQVPGLRFELDRVCAERDALVVQRDELLEVLRRNRSGPALAIEAPKPAEVVVERESITLPDPEPSEPHEVLPPAASTRRGGPMRFRPLGAQSQGDGWDRFRSGDGHLW